MNQFTSEQFEMTTAEAELQYFTGYQEPALRMDPSAVLPGGRYRLIEGELWRLLPHPPEHEEADRTTRD